jgi:hypothetical protein
LNPADRASQNGSNACPELAVVKRLDQVIIGAHFEQKDWLEYIHCPA